jgi:hypothetical protein
MPESKADTALRANMEVVNFKEYGDARGPEFLAHHPEARSIAESHLRQLGAPVAAAEFGIDDTAHFNQNQVA